MSAEVDEYAASQRLRESIDNGMCPACLSPIEPDGRVIMRKTDGTIMHWECREIDMEPETVNQPVFPAMETRTVNFAGERYEAIVDQNGEHWWMWHGESTWNRGQSPFDDSQDRDFAAGCASVQSLSHRLVSDSGETSVQWGCPPPEHPDLYAELDEILARAYAQCSEGKGKERHANNDRWIDQPICTEGRAHGNPAFVIGQARKKALEALRLDPDRARCDLLGAIVYLAAAVRWFDEQAAEVLDGNNGGDKQ